jgi:succinate dehydrogenase/fumarate reductase flavoprotein subunit
MWQYVSLCRDEAGLLEARERIHALQQSLFGVSKENNERSSHWQETANMLLVAQLVIAAALQRRESRGSHWRLDYERLDETLTGLHYAFVREAVPDAQALQEEVIVHA